MAQAPRITAELCAELDDFIEHFQRIVADGVVDADERAEHEMLAGDLIASAGDVDQATAIAVVTVRRGLRSDRRTRLVAEVTRLTVAA